MGNKNIRLTIAATSSTGSCVGGVFMMIGGGPIGAIAGGVLLSGGISGGINTV